MTQHHFSILKSLNINSLFAFGAIVLGSSIVQAQPLSDGPTRLIVKYKSAAISKIQNATINAVSHEDAALDMLNRFVERTGLDIAFQRELLSGAELISLENGLSQNGVATAMDAFRNDPNVEYVVEDARMYPTLTPDDPLFADQWHYGTGNGGINVEAAWDIRPRRRARGRGVVVAVLDTGILAGHEDLTRNLLPGYDMISDTATSRDNDGRDSNPADEGDWYEFAECGPPRAADSSWHGSHVAGTIAAARNNVGGTGVAFLSRYVPVRVLGRCGGSLSDIVDGILWSAGISVAGIPANSNPADIINMSLGGQGACDSAYQDAINQVVARGVTVVVAAGNSSANAANFRPASCDNVISVASVGDNGGRASYSNFGAVVDVAAPGGGGRGATNVLSTTNTGRTTPTGEDTYERYAGTSMAAPHVAGVAAMMYGVNPDITPAQVEEILEDTARAFPATCSQCGTGIIDAEAAVQAAIALDN